MFFYSELQECYININNIPFLCLESKGEFWIVSAIFYPQNEKVEVKKFEDKASATQWIEHLGKHAINNS